MAKKSKKQAELPLLVSNILNASDSEDVLTLLEEVALRAVNANLSKSDMYTYNDPVRDRVVMDMIRDVAKDGNTVEWVMASQFIALSLSGINTLSRSYAGDKGQALQFLRLSQTVLETLEKYRNNQKTALAEEKLVSLNG